MLLPKFFSVLALVATLSTLAAPTAVQNANAPHSATALTHSPAQPQKLDGVPNFAEVTPHLYRGGQPNHEGLKRLANAGVKIVVDLRGSGERSQVEKLGMTYIAIPWHCPFPKDAVFAKFIAVTRANPDKKIFVHCRLGDDRGGMMIAAYRMAEQGWSAEEAKEEMKAFGFDFFHRRICTGLSDYEEHFPRHWRESHAFENLRSTTPPTQP